MDVESDDLRRWQVLIFSQEERIFSTQEAIISVQENFVLSHTPFFLLLVAVKICLWQQLIFFRAKTKDLQRECLMVSGS